MQLFIDNLTNSDFCYLHPARGLLGETWLSNIQLHGLLDEQGMVCDFGHVKREVRQLLDEHIDHCLLVPGRATNVEVEEQQDDLLIRWQLEQPNSLVEHLSPRQCVTIIDAETITGETVARWCEQQLRCHLPDSISHIEVSFSVETIDGPHYQYSHGLKKHDGKCQRIAHGHRSKIDIMSEGKRAPELEREWAQRFNDVHIATAEDQIPCEQAGHLCFQYQAREGQFRLLLPESQCVIINTDSTVENIAQYIGQQIQQQRPELSCRVKAYEGIRKGAIIQTNPNETSMNNKQGNEQKNGLESGEENSV